MSSQFCDQGIPANSRIDLRREIQAFLIDRKTRGLAPGSIKFYRSKLRTAARFFESIGITDVAQIRARDVRAMLVTLGENHNPGGLHGIFRAFRTFLYWWEVETEPKGWSNPLRKVKPPRLDDTPLEPVSLDDLRAMLATCNRKRFYGARDEAMLLFLLDSGCRRAELHALNIGDVDLTTGSVHIARGKGGKSRTTFIGSKTRRAVVRYLRFRAEIAEEEPLWVTSQGKRLRLQSLREVLRRRAKRAGVEAPTLHSFRRGFAISALRSGCDLITLQRMLGRSSLAIVGRYLRQVEDDLWEAHERVGPVDHML